MNESTENLRPAREGRRTSLEAFNWNAGLRTFFDTTCGANQFIFVSFALALGLQKERMGLITSVVSFACVLQLLSVAVVNFLPDKKSFILSVGLLEPLLLIAMALAAPFLPAGLRLWALGAGVFLAASSFHLTRPLADNWLASSIPVGVRANYLGRRFRFIAACTIGAMLTAGYVAERIDKTDVRGLGCVLAVGGLFGALAVLALWKAPMPGQSAFARLTWKDAREVLHARPFRNYVTGYFIFNLPFLLSVPYYQVFNLKVLHMKESRIAWMMIGYFVMKLLTMGIGARYVRLVGARRAIWATAPFYVLFFLLFLCSTPERVWPLFAAWAMVGAAESVFAIAATISLYDSIPETPARPVYFAVNNVMATGMLCVGGAMAIPILESLKGASIRIGPLTLEQFHCYYGLCAVVMLGAMFGAAFFPTREKEKFAG